MYKIYRLLSYSMMEFDDHLIYSFKMSKKHFIVDDKKFMQLQELVKLNEYDYEKVPNMFFLDVSPYLIEKFDEDFAQDYKDSLGDKFFVCYLYEVLNE